MKYIKDLIDKNQEKYPGWLFKWLVRKHWIFPKPRVFTNRFVVSDSMMMTANTRTLQQEVAERMVSEMWDSILEYYRKYSYTPSYRDVVFDRKESFMDNGKEFILRVECRYNPHWSFGQMSGFIHEIERMFKTAS